MESADANLNDEYRTLGGPIGATFAGARIDEFLARRFPFLTRAEWQRRLKAGTVLTGRGAVRPSYRIQENDRVFFHHPRVDEPEVDDGVYPLWEQDRIMAVFKPGNLPMHENGPYRKNTFAELVKTKIGPEWSALHRLDRETSGIVICGSDPLLRKRLSDTWSKAVAKRYVAIARGTAAQDEWTVNGPLGDLKESLIRIKQWVVPDGLPAVTEFRVLARARNHVLLEARPLTGRTNQIRVHAAYSGLPLLGDKLYHPDEQVFLDYFMYGPTDDVIRRTGHPRLCLHAAGIEFRHPASGDPCRVSSPIPPDMVEAWERISLGR